MNGSGERGVKASTTTAVHRYNYSSSNVQEIVDLSHNFTPSHLSTSVLFHPHPVTSQVSLLHRTQSRPTTTNAEAHDTAYTQHQSRKHKQSLVSASAVTRSYSASNNREGSSSFTQPQPCRPRSFAPFSALGTILSQIPKGYSRDSISPFPFPTLSTISYKHGYAHAIRKYPERSHMQVI